MDAQQTGKAVYAGLLGTVVKLLNEEAGSTADDQVVFALENVRAAQQRYLENDPTFMTSLLLGMANLINIKNSDLRRKIAGHLHQKVILPD